MSAQSPCRQCGRCCQVISLDWSLAELQDLAEREEQRAERDPHWVHGAEARRLVADVAFIRRHFHELSRPAAIQRNPAMAAPDFDQRHFYECDQLGPDQRCSSHSIRPFVCAGYPWYYGRPERALLVCTPCGYEEEVLVAAGEKRGGPQKTDDFPEQPRAAVGRPAPPESSGLV